MVGKSLPLIFIIFFVFRNFYCNAICIIHLVRSESFAHILNEWYHVEKDPFPANIDLFKAKNRKLEEVVNMFKVSKLWTYFIPFFYCFYCWLWTSQCWLRMDPLSHVIIHLICAQNFNIVSKDHRRTRFFRFRLEAPFLGKFGPKNQNCQFKLKLGI